MTAPRGWELVRHDGDFTVPPPNSDDLVALADAVREAARPPESEDPQPPTPGRRGHLRVLNGNLGS